MLRQIQSRLRGAYKRLKQELFYSTERPHLLASALGLGAFLGIFPIWGLQTFLAIVLAHLLKLNKALVLLGTCISIPPLFPFVILFSYQLGAFLVGQPLEAQLEHGYSLLNTSFQLAGTYFAGAIPLSLLAGLAVYILVRVILWIFRERNQTKIFF